MKKTLRGNAAQKHNPSTGASAWAPGLVTPHLSGVTAPGTSEDGGEDPEQDGRLPFPVVALGASAGGLDAFTRILHHLPGDTGMAFVLIQHLAPQHTSMLAPLLSRATSMPVEEVRHGVGVRANHVYVIPPNKRMRIARGVLTLEPRQKSGGAPKPIDDFFLSLAESQKSSAIGVVLTGADNDGALGLQAIKAEGGIVLAQDEPSAAFKDMPRNAVATGQVDLSLPPEQIAAQLTRIGRDPCLGGGPAREDDKTDPAWSACRNRVFAILRNATGVDFQHYRIGTVRRRLHRRMLLSRCESLDAYVALLRTSPTERRSLHDDLLISVNGFFRDPEVYQAIEDHLVPRLLAGRSAGTPIRVWVPGCSTGEEAYSLAMCLFDLIERHGTSVSVQIFGTDINDSAIARARAAVYSEQQVLQLPPDRVRRFFVKLESGYRIEPRIRESCVFARHNLLSDPPFSRLDLVSCRNVLICLQPAIHPKILSAFHYSLKPDGFLVLGKSESIPGAHGQFALVDGQNRLYARCDGFGAPAAAFRIAGADPSGFVSTVHETVPSQGAPSASEELQSANEELQSANEELQTAQEELQATNEELTTLNDELQTRNLELGRLGDDLQNLLSSMTLPTVMLDNQLRIRRFTPAAEQVMNLRPGDIGRPFADIRTNLVIEDFEAILRDVLSTLKIREAELQDRAGRWHLLRVRPYRTSDNRIEGLVLLAIDITQMKQAEAILMRERQRLVREVMEGSQELARSGRTLAEERKGRRKVESALQHSREELDISRSRMRLLAGELLHAQDGERSRVSRELHDDLSQKLVLIEFNLHRLEQHPPSSQQELQARLEAVRNQIGEFSVDLRRIAYKLHPSTLDHLGFVIALRALAAEFSRREGHPVKVACRNMPPSLPPDVGASAYRIVQEALRNVARHAGKGTKVSISVGTSRAGLRLSIRDDGAGFDPRQLKDRPGLGLISMQERARLLDGSFAVASEPGQGVHILVRIPLAGEKQS